MYRVEMLLFAFLYREDIELLEKPIFDRCYISFDSAQRDRKMSLSLSLSLALEMAERIWTNLGSFES